MYDQKIAEKHLNKLLRRYKIHVYQWSKSSCGRAYYNQKRIKIPHPTDVDRFCVCMHEIKHIIDGAGKFSFEDEYNADKFAIEQLRELGFEGEGGRGKRRKTPDFQAIKEMTLSPAKGRGLLRYALGREACAKGRGLSGRDLLRSRH
jgi:hypothetical protein